MNYLISSAYWQLKIGLVKSTYINALQKQVEKALRIGGHPGYLPTFLGDEQLFIKFKRL
ncbi:hypothetical protein [uncultured Lactobacillus sp.]|uniref:hypothetical protein n=1 Tax=uncultured Lactobacillus sp. TaxID=153152 RepID=UPI0025E81C67|nr:hypothetical protein [uncultured Lactobacillus sp.]